MKRWHLTLGLAGSALVAAALAPRLSALLAISAGPTVADPVPPEPMVVVAPVVTPAEVTQGRLIVDAGLDQSAVLKGTGSERFVTITVKAPPGEGEMVRQPVNVAVVMDISGSMQAQGKIEHARAAARAMARAMGPEDSYSLVAFNDDARVVVPAGPVHDLDRVLRQIDRIYEGGGTNLYAGMGLGERQVQTLLDPGEIGRVVVISDGNANVGVTAPDSLSRFAATAASKGITVSTMGLGVDYNEDLLAKIADLGGGTYDYVDQPSELEGVFTAELGRVSTVVARNTALTIRLPANVEPLEVIGWDAERTSNGWTVFMGDVHAGAERKIIARVRVTGTAEGALDVASVRADYVDLIDQVPSSSEAVAVAEITVDPNRVAASVDADRTAAASIAWGNRYLEMSTRAYADGDVRKAKQILNEGSGYMRQAAASTGDARLAEDAKSFDLQLEIYDDNAPSTERGQRAIKMNKEAARDAYR